MLHGFDSSEGVPESGTACYIEGLFAAAGQTSRSSRTTGSSFFKGWFEGTLLNGVLPRHDVLSVNIDCNIYLWAVRRP
jgi:hypothetical protein